MSAAHLYSVDPKLRNFRTVVDDDGAFITISQEHMASSNKKSKVSEVSAALDLTLSEAEWMHSALGEVIAARKAAK